MLDAAKRRELVTSFFRYHPVAVHVWSADRVTEEQYDVERPRDHDWGEGDTFRGPDGEVIRWDRVARVVDATGSEEDDPAMIAFLEPRLPAFETHHFASLVADSTTREVLRLLLLSNPHRLADCARDACDRLDAERRTAICDAVIDALSEPDFELANLLLAVGLMGEPRHLLALGDYLVCTDGSAWLHTAFALAALRMNATRDAYMQVQRACHESSTLPVIGRARETFLRIAGDRKVTHWEVEDELVPRCGLRSDGEPTITRGDQRLFMALDDELNPFLRDPDGRRMPALETSQPPAPAETRRRWAVIREQLSEAIPVQVRRLEEALVQQHRWEIARWREALLGHPLVVHLVERAVWGTYSRGGRRLEQTFRVAPDRTLWGPDDEPWGFGEADAIGLVHPLEVDAETRKAWNTILADYEVVTLFPQLDRPTFAPPKDVQRAPALVVDVEAPADTLIRLHHRGWKRESGWHGTRSLTKAFRNRQVKARLQYDERDDGTVLYRALEFDRYLSYPQTRFELRDVAEVPYSETVYEVESLRMPQETGGWPAVRTLPKS
jgi:hypothetical protein